MFGLFTPRLPLGTWEKTWCETRMCWLAAKLGIDRLKKATVILPNDEFFPEPYKGTPEDVRRLMEQLCGYMGIDPSPIALKLHDEVEMPGAAGLYDARKRKVIRIARTQLADAQSLLGTLAHELAHELLLGGGLLTAEVSDHEWITDLLPVYLGVGVFAANSVIREKYVSDGQWSWWWMKRQGYLPARMFGYAFALFAFMRGETKPSWAKRLRLDAANAMEKGLRFLGKTGDTLFHPDQTLSEASSLSATTAMEELKEGTPTRRLAMLWKLRQTPLGAADVVEAVVDCLHDRDPDIPGEAARTLAEFGAPAAAYLPALLDMLHHGNPAARPGAAAALGRLRLEPEQIIPELCFALGEENRALLWEVAEALVAYGRPHPSALPRIVPPLIRAINAGDGLMHSLARAALTLIPEPIRTMDEYLHVDNPAMREAVVELLEDELCQQRKGKAMGASDADAAPAQRESGIPRPDARRYNERT